jgi:hypothetical protein
MCGPPRKWRGPSCELRRSPVCEFDGIVELTFATRDDLVAAFESQAGRALAGDERNFLAGKIVCDGDTVEPLSGAGNEGARKLICVFYLNESCDAESVWREWESKIIERAKGATLVKGLAVHRVRSSIRQGTEETRRDRVPAVLIYHLEPSQHSGGDDAFRALAQLELAPDGGGARISRFLVEPRVLLG